jgi:hypothetical protein
LEKQSTNLILWSEQFDNTGAWTTAGSTVTANNTTSPDGTQNADLLTFNVTAYPSIYQAVTTTNGATYTASIYAKKGNQNFLGLEIRGASSATDTVFNLNTGVVVSGTGTIENVGNGWYRCSITKVANSTSTLLIIGRGDTAVSGDTLYLYGCQLEASSYSTSYVPTLASSVTRLADAAFKTGISSLFGANAGTIYFETIYYPETNIGGGERFVYAQEDTSAGFIRLWQDLVGGNQQFRMLVNDGGTQQVNASVNVSTFLSTTQPSAIKWAMAYEANRFVTYINGVQRMIDTSGTAPTISEINFNNTFQTLMPLAQALVFPTALSDTQLAELTTL